VESAAAGSDGLQHIRDRARELFRHGDDLEIDQHNFTHHNETDGYWVGAWLFVRDREVKKEDDDGTDS